MQTCETCRHWDTKLCPAGFGYCDKADDDDGSREMFSVFAPAFGGTWGGLLQTRADFGCIAHEPRE